MPTWKKVLLEGDDVAAESVQGGEFPDAGYSFPGAVAVDTINEYTANTGVTIDGLLIKDGFIQGAHTLARASGSITLTTSFQDMPGCSASLTPGTYLVWGVLHTYNNGSTNDSGNNLVGELVVATNPAESPQVKRELGQGGASGEGSAMNMWRIVLNSTATIKLQAKKTGGTGYTMVLATHSSLTALRVA